MGLLAHQGGWDEILLILGPMAVVVLLLRLAKRRVERNLAASGTAPSAGPGAAAPDVAPTATTRGTDEPDPDRPR